MKNSNILCGNTTPKRCLITGATGYIGSQLARYLLDKGWEVHIIVRNESNFNSLFEIKDRLLICLYDGSVESIIAYFESNRVDVVFHLAALVLSNIRPEQVSNLIRSNIEFGAQVLEAMKEAGVKYIVSTGTYWQNYNNNNYCPVDLYSATKEAFEKILQYYTDTNSVNAITLRLFDVYGPNDYRPKLLNYLIYVAGKNISVDVSPGEQELDMVYISDVCSAYLKSYELLLADNTIKNETFGVFTGNRYTLKKLVYLLSESINKKINVNFGAKPYKERTIMKPIDSLKKLPNWKATVDIEKGLLKCVINETE